MESGELENKIQLLEQWRDWHWNQHFYHKYVTGNTKDTALYDVSSCVYDDVLSILKEDTPIPEIKCPTFWGLHYGKYPEGE
jgi:hypothetical protein